MYNDEIKLATTEPNIDVFHTVHGKALEIIRNLYDENKALRQEIETLRQDVEAFGKEVNLCTSNGDR